MCMSQASGRHTDRLLDRLTGSLTILVRQTVSHVLAEETIANNTSACLLIGLSIIFHSLLKSTAVTHLSMSSGFQEVQ